MDLVNRITSERKVRKNVGTSKFEYSEGPLGDVLGTSRINLPGTSLERRIRTSPERHFRTSLGRQIGMSSGRQIGTSPGLSNRIFRGCPGDVGGGRPGDQYLPAGRYVYLSLLRSSSGSCSMIAHSLLWSRA